MNDELTEQALPVVTASAVPVKNRGGRPKRNAVASSLQEVVKMMESLSRSEAPNAARQRLLDRQYEYFAGLQQREDAQKNDKTAAENRELREQNTALQKENTDLRARPEPEIDIDAMLIKARSASPPETDHSACIPKSLHESEMSKRDKTIVSLEEKSTELTAEIERVKDIAEEGIKIRLNNARLWNQNDLTAKHVDELEKQHNDLRKKLERKPLYQPDPPSKEQQEYLEKLNRDTQEWHRRSAELNLESVL
jgi:hypothetical protein